MRKGLQNIILLGICAVATLACTQNTYTPDFLLNDTMRLEIGKKTMFSYSPQSCQYTYNTERKEYRVHTDNMSDYFTIRFEQMPSSDMGSVTAEYLEWTTNDWSNRTRKNIAFEIVKNEGDMYWLWNSRESIKITLRIE